MLFNAVNGKGPCGSQFCALQSYPRPILTHWRDRASPMNADCWANIPRAHAHFFRRNDKAPGGTVYLPT